MLCKCASHFGTLSSLTFALLSRKVIIFRQSSSSGNFAVIHLIDAVTDYFNVFRIF
jgi:hypothetical protein